MPKTFVHCLGWDGPFEREQDGIGLFLLAVGGVLVIVDRVGPHELQFLAWEGRSESGPFGLGQARFISAEKHDECHVNTILFFN